MENLKGISTMKFCFLLYMYTIVQIYNIFLYFILTMTVYIIYTAFIFMVELHVITQMITFVLLNGVHHYATWYPLQFV